MAPSGPAKPPVTERILATADRLFYGHGIRAVGVDAIAAEAGVSKRSLYDYFPSKDALVLAYLERRFRDLPTSDRPPADQILAVFDRLERVSTDETFRGCAFVNAVVEVGASVAAVGDLARRFKEDRQHWFHALLRRLDVAETDADLLSMQLALLVDGAIAAALVRRDPAMAHAAGEAARTLLQASGVVVGER